MKQSILLLLATLLSTTAAFQTGGSSISSRRCNGALFSAVADEQEIAVKNDLLKRDRYVATNRFTVRPGRAAKFEKRWGELFIVMQLWQFQQFHCLSYYDVTCVSISFFSRRNVSFFHSQLIDPLGWPS